MLNLFIDDLEVIAHEIDEVIPNGSASKTAHLCLGRWKSKRGTFMDLADPDVIKWKEIISDGKT